MTSDAKKPTPNPAPDYACERSREPEIDVSGLAPTPSAKVRKKPGNQGRRASNAEVQVRIHAVARMLIDRIPKHQIKRSVKDKFGLGARMCENYISRARQYLIERTKRPKEDHISDALGFYEQVIRNPETDLGDKMRAQDTIVSLLGLSAPTKIAPTTPDGQSPYVSDEILSKLPPEQLAVLHEVHMALRAAKAKS